MFLTSASNQINGVCIRGGGFWIQEMAPVSSVSAITFVFNGRVEVITTFKYLYFATKDDSEGCKGK